MTRDRPNAPSIFPLDKALALPARSFSYELQRRLVKAAVQNPFLESVQTIADGIGRTTYSVPASHWYVLLYMLSVLPLGSYRHFD